MDLPVHLAAGALIGNIVLHVDRKYPVRVSAMKHHAEVGTAAFLLGILSHLAADAVPHYDWLFHVKAVNSLPIPYAHVLPQLIVSVPVLILIAFLVREHPVTILGGVAGGIYPDFEKVAFLDWEIPRSLVIFRWHSCYLTHWTPWEWEHKTFLIVFEMTLLALLLFINAWWMWRRTCPQTFAHLMNDTIQFYRNILVICVTQKGKFVLPQNDVPRIPKYIPPASRLRSQGKVDENEAKANRDPQACPVLRATPGANVRKMQIKP